MTRPRDQAVRRRPSGAAATAIVDEIERLGPIRFDRYMELALYAPGGYYDDPPIGAGPAGDFVTGPHVHEVFGQLVAEAIRGLLDAMDVTSGGDLIEVGAGDGTLMRAMLPSLDGVRVTTVERSPGARAALETIDGVEVRESMSAISTPIVVLAHELADNLPFRRVRRVAEGLAEVHVGVGDGRLVEVLAPVADELELPVRLDEGEEAIVPTGAASFVADVLVGPPPRALLMIDYGSDRGAAGPAHGYASHRVIEDLLAAPGETDITAGVDFGFLAHAARANGLQPFPTVTQREALVALGLESWLRTELERQQDLLGTGRGADAVRVWGGRSRATMLADPAGLGRFRWFVVTTPDVEEPAWLRAARASRAET
ncbi:MAG TPA: SAM-dependent methyltransferase [Actinomycetota bacterium]|nr:SAM-dependent methyltransferase [Actinomycetota bacterium]